MLRQVERTIIVNVQVGQEHLLFNCYFLIMKRCSEANMYLNKCDLVTSCLANMQFNERMLNYAVSASAACVPEGCKRGCIGDGERRHGPQTCPVLRPLISWAGLSAAHTSSSTSPEGVKALRSSGLYRLSGLSGRRRVNALACAELWSILRFPESPRAVEDLPPCVEVGHAAFELVPSQHQGAAAVWNGRAALLLTFVLLIDEQLSPGGDNVSSC